MARYIGKCRFCKQTTAKDYSDFETKTVNPGTMYARPVKVWGRMVEGAFFKAEYDNHCTACGKREWLSRPVQGFVTDHKCAAKCRNSKGHICECSCGGKNYGQGFLSCELVAA